MQVDSVLDSHNILVDDISDGNNFSDLFEFSMNGMFNDFRMGTRKEDFGIDGSTDGSELGSSDSVDSIPVSPTGDFDEGSFVNQDKSENVTPISEEKIDPQLSSFPFFVGVPNSNQGLVYSIAQQNGSNIVYQPISFTGTGSNTSFTTGTSNTNNLVQFTQPMMLDTNSYLQLRNQLVQYRGMINNQQVITVHPTLYMYLVYQQLLSQSQVSTSNTVNTNITTTTSTVVNNTTTKSSNINRKDNITNSNNVKNTINPKKRKAVSPKKTQRRVRPKVMPEKGALQCKGMNRKKNQRCRNAALMEFIGPRPKYCAEHIHLDNDCLYMKCASPYHKNPGDKKKCREVVLKEFGLCHKHYRDGVLKLDKVEGLTIAYQKLYRVNELLDNLEAEAMKAKKTNADLYQRKNKLIPKFIEMKQILMQKITELKNQGYTTDVRKSLTSSNQDLELVPQI